MNSRIDNIHYMKKSFKQLHDVYGFTTKESRKIISKVSYELAQMTSEKKIRNTSGIGGSFSLDKLTYEAIMGRTTYVNVNINPFSGSFRIERSPSDTSLYKSTGDLFRDEVMERMQDFFNQHENSTYKKEVLNPNTGKIEKVEISLKDTIDKYYSGQIDYNTLKEEIDQFKRTSEQYAQGSERKSRK